MCGNNDLFPGSWKSDVKMAQNSFPIFRGNVLMMGSGGMIRSLMTVGQPLWLACFAIVVLFPGYLLVLPRYYHGQQRPDGTLLYTIFLFFSSSLS